MAQVAIFYNQKRTWDMRLVIFGSGLESILVPSKLNNRYILHVV